MPEKKQDHPEETPEAIPNPSPANEDQGTEPKAAEATAAAGSGLPEQALVVHQPRPVTPNEERTWAMLAHLSVLLNLATGFLGGIAAIIIYFIYKDRSRLVAYHAMQAFIFQAIAWLGASLVSGFLIAVGGALGFLIIPLLCLIPGFLILLLIPVSLIYGIIGGVKVNNGEDFRYWLVGDWVRDILEPKAPIA